MEYEQALNEKQSQFSEKDMQDFQTVILILLTNQL